MGLQGFTRHSRAICYKVMGKKNKAVKRMYVGHTEQYTKAIEENKARGEVNKKSG